jgi:tetratricopeptide (TPR) repeat protein
MGKDSFATLGLPRNLGGVFTLSRNGYAALAKIDQYAKTSDESDVSRATILHEYHHFLMHYSPETTSYPTWYDEGMSEYWSSLVIQDGMAWFGHPVEFSGREALLRDQSGSIRFDTKWLFSSPKLKFDETRSSNFETGRFYAQSNYAIHYFNSSPELRRQLAHYLRLHNMGLSQEQAVRIAFKKTYAELDSDLRIYVERRLTARGFSTGKDGLDLPQVPIKVTKLDQAATYYVLADVVPRFGQADHDVTKELIETNIKLHPDDARANALAIAYNTFGDMDTRLPALLQRFPNDARLLALRAESLRNAAVSMRETGAPGWEPLALEARTLYRHAIKTDPDLPLAYLGLGYLYTLLPENEPVQEGIAGLDTAVIYESGPWSFSALARFYLRDKQWRNALQSMRSAVAFDIRGRYSSVPLQMENLELIVDMDSGATPDGKGLRYKSGAVYEGTLADGKPHGKGKWLRPNGSYYEGDFVQGLPSGHGKLVSERGGVYEGEFVAGMMRGTGHMTYPTTGKWMSYEGAVKDGLPEGAGALVTKDGRLEATFLHGQAEGNGTFVPAHGGAPIQGKWIDGDYQWPAADNIVFTGGIDANGRRYGRGWCQTAGSQKIDSCRYKDGRKVALDSGDDD